MQTKTACPRRRRIKWFPEVVDDDFKARGLDEARVCLAIVWFERVGMDGTAIDSTLAGQP